MALSGLSLDAAVAVGPGVPIYPDIPAFFAGIGFSTTGSPTIDLALEGTIDGVNWKTIAAVSAFGGTVGFVSGTSNAPPSSNAIPFVAFRANLTAISGGASPTVSASLAIVPGM